MNKILIIDDDANIRELVTRSMEYEGYVCMEAEDGPSGLNAARADGPDLILLDLMLPYMDGMTVLKKLRYADLLTPVIIMTAKSDETDKIIGLGFGADDYITKPFSVRELSARVEAVLRRYKRAEALNAPEDETDGGRKNGSAAGDRADETPIAIGDVVIDIPRHEVLRTGIPVALSLKEFELLRVLAENRRRVLTREQLIGKVWGYDYASETRTVDVHVRHLRRKLGDEIVQTVRGLGYKIP
jgi:two-component system alkaline phosphatase synthesis response regulator PhoP